MANTRTRIRGAITILPFDTEGAEFYGAIRAELKQAGNLPGDADLMIAATALQWDLAVVTGNIRHFERVPGLRIERAFAEARTA